MFFFALFAAPLQFKQSAVSFQHSAVALALARI
jgi:hypothetical protein